MGVFAGRVFSAIEHFKYFDADDRMHQRQNANENAGYVTDPVGLKRDDGDTKAEEVRGGGRERPDQQKHVRIETAAKALEPREPLRHVESDASNYIHVDRERKWPCHAVERGEGRNHLEIEEDDAARY